MSNARMRERHETASERDARYADARMRNVDPHEFTPIDPPPPHPADNGAFWAILLAIIVAACMVVVGVSMFVSS